MHGSCASLCIGHFTVIAVMTSARRTTGGGEDRGRDGQTDGSHNHQNHSDRRQSESVCLCGGDRPVHDSTSGDGNRTEDHSCQTHFVPPTSYLTVGQVEGGGDWTPSVLFTLAGWRQPYGVDALRFQRDPRPSMATSSGSCPKRAFAIRQASSLLMGILRSSPVRCARVASPGPRPRSLWGIQVMPMTCSS